MGCHEIGVSVRVRRTFTLNNVDETFGVLLHILMRWDTDEEAPKEMTGITGGCGWEPMWKPNWHVANVMEELQCTTFYDLQQCTGGKGSKKNTVFAEIKYQVRIYNAMDLHKFPFDTQTFAIKVELDGQDISIAKFVEYGGGVPVADALLSRCHFQDMRPVIPPALKGSDPIPVNFDFYVTSAEASRRGLSISGLQLSFMLNRVSSYYIINVGGIMLLISSFILSAWSCEEVGDRLGVDFTLLLTAVAFKLVLVTMLPPVSYLTEMDWYVMLCLALLGVATIEHCVVAIAVSDAEDEAALEAAVNLDHVMFWVTAGAWTLFNIIACVRVKILIRARDASGIKVALTEGAK